MGYKALYVFVEGSDDRRFFERIIKPWLERKRRYDWIKMIEYAHLKKGKVSNFIRSIGKMNADYIFGSDINDMPCVTRKKEKLQDTFPGIGEDRIIAVIREIEGWYLAGLDNQSSRKLGIPSHSHTDHITKEQFDNLIPQKFDSRIDFMQEILKCFDIATAKLKNKSFKYFLKKHDCEG